MCPVFLIFPHYPSYVFTYSMHAHNNRSGLLVAWAIYLHGVTAPASRNRTSNEYFCRLENIMRPFSESWNTVAAYSGITCNSRCADNGNRRAQLRLTSDGSCYTLCAASSASCAIARTPSRFSNCNLTRVVYREIYAVPEDSLFAIGNRVLNNLL